GRSSLSVAFDIADGAELRYQPHALILGKGARFTQTIKVRIKGNGRLLLKDSWAAGRIAMGEIWQFERFKNEIEIWIDDSIVYFERSAIVPVEMPITSPVVFGRYSLFSSHYCFGIWPEPPLRELQALLPSREQQQRPDFQADREDRADREDSLEAQEAAGGARQWLLQRPQGTIFRTAGYA
ncbi:MAG TPA: urease accessory protein UreD, partial [Chroococcales cyanobacterium]